MAQPAAQRLTSLPGCVMAAIVGTWFFVQLSSKQQCFQACVIALSVGLCCSVCSDA